MTKSRPLIGITHSVHQSFIVIWAMKLVVWLAGGIPMSITTKQNASRFDYAGLILGGGVDINPERYGKEKKLHYAYDLERDQLEFDHFVHADKKGLPVLGICRGAQLMNVARGGTLHIDVEKFYEKIKQLFFCKFLYSFRYTQRKRSNSCVTQ
ncbi:gamma-glutamyl-gamma-aminobutyrate hydrolase family protein [Legionella yabuuchiae]|uniref:gamma-glutamyl-gamma-aminobutyrate hydrolase family protein n=1 Tax=Legionella yabuuchiae TaxID=376727 RepID=UPI001055F085|nr:gamma-glutamyl-gamma-aminobutyrate hydrolase family protein [Legionella yabuuchiae]